MDFGTHTITRMKYANGGTTAVWRTNYFSLSFGEYSPNPNGQIAQLVQHYNDQLQKHVSDWTHTLPEIARGNLSLTLLDTTPVWERVLENPTKYGAPNATCQALLNYVQEGKGNGCLWQDLFHPGRVMNMEMGKAMKGVLEESRFWGGS